MYLYILLFQASCMGSKLDVFFSRCCTALLSSCELTVAFLFFILFYVNWRLTVDNIESLEHVRCSGFGSDDESVATREDTTAVGH